MLSCCNVWLASKPVSYRPVSDSTTQSKPNRSSAIRMIANMNALMNKALAVTGYKTTTERKSANDYMTSHSCTPLTQIVQSVSKTATTQ